ncbi:MAG: hypothetical protein ACPGUU_01265 [Flavobacteriaceae bacterium]
MGNKKPSDEPTPNPQNVISLEIAQNWSKRWNTFSSDFNKERIQKIKTKGKYTKTKAFFIPITDLIEAINEVNGTNYDPELGNNVDGIRAYIGVEQDDLNSDIYTEKLMIVGVKNNKDILPGRTDNDSDVNALLENGGGDIYDFSKPCPKLCDEGSPLN